MGYRLGIMSNVLKDFSVSIDGTKITNGQVQEITMRWNIDNFRITGVLMFSDETGLVEELPIRGGNTVVMKMTDYDDIVSTQTFKVTEVNTTRTTSQPIVNLSLVDTITVAAMQKYVESSWSSEDMIGIIDHVDTMKPVLVGKKKDFCPPPPPHKNFCTPLHVSFNVTMHWLAKNADVMLYQTREDFVIQPLKTLFGRGKKGKKFMLKVPNESYRRNIYEYKLGMGKFLSATTLQPKGKAASFDPSNKHSKHTSNDFSTARGKLGESATFGKTPDAQESTEAKYFYKSDYHINETTSKQWMKHAYQDVTLEILVPGQFGTNIGDIVEVEWTNWLKQKGPEKNVNGLWMVIEIIDVIRPPDFAQRITLGRSKYFK